ncbi:MAG: hypothetical protein IPH31_25680 [Lewinellaceae bacterium]|nr:hypothetical protein [Lewinellaceae bacterium]
MRIAVEEYGLRDKSVVREFVKWFRRNNELSGDKYRDSSQPATLYADSAQMATEKRV